MEYRFEPKTRKEYQIIRDYYVSNNHLQGIYFLLYDEEKKELFTRFLEKDAITNFQYWKRKSLFNQLYQTTIVEKGYGKENKVIIETGILIIKNKSFENNTEKQKVAERTVFLLAPSVFKPF